MTAPLAPAVELGMRLDRVLDDFARDNEALVRQACEVSDTEPLRPVVVCAMLGHVLSVEHRKRGRALTERLCLFVLDQFDALVRNESAVLPDGTVFLPAGFHRWGEGCPEHKKNPIGICNCNRGEPSEPSFHGSGGVD